MTGDNGVTDIYICNLIYKRRARIRYQPSAWISSPFFSFAFPAISFITLFLSFSLSLSPLFHLFPARSRNRAAFNCGYFPLSLNTCPTCAGTRVLACIPRHPDLSPTPTRTYMCSAYSACTSARTRKKLCRSAADRCVLRMIYECPLDRD